MEKIILDTVGAFITKILTALEKQSGRKMGPPRPMKYPYTFTAKCMQFPYRYYIEKNWIFKYYFMSIILCVPIFYKLERLGEYKWLLSGRRKTLLISIAKSPGNVANWNAIQEKEKHHGGGHEVYEEPPEKAHTDDSEWILLNRNTNWFIPIKPFITLLPFQISGLPLRFMFAFVVVNLSRTAPTNRLNACNVCACVGWNPHK